MAGRVNWEANVSSNVREVLEYTDKLRGELEKLENGNYGIKLNIDEKRLASVISNLDKMLSSLGKGSGDFKQFENLSKELSGIISEVQNLSKAFGKVDDSGTKTLLSSIQNIDKSLSELSQHIINVNKNMGNIGGDTNGAVKQVENISNAYDNAAKSAEKLADAQSKIGNKSNISSGNIKEGLKESIILFDNYGRELDDVHSKLLKTSKMMNTQGKLITLFHGSPNDFDSFKINSRGRFEDALGVGAYFFDNPSDSIGYGNVSQWFANVEKIFDTSCKLSAEEIKAIYDKYSTQIKEIFNIDTLLDFTSFANKNPINSLKSLSAQMGFDSSYLMRELGYDAIIDRGDTSTYVILDENKIIKANSALKEQVSLITDIQEAKRMEESADPKRNFNQSVIDGFKAQRKAEQEAKAVLDNQSASVIEGQNKLKEGLKEVQEQAEQTAKSVQEVSDSPIEDVFQGGKIDQATTSAKELDKTLEQVDIPTDSFDDVLSKLDLTESKLKEIVKITKQSVSDSEGKFHDSYTLKDKRGSTEIYGLSSNTEKGQLLRSNIVGYDAKEIEQEAKALNQAWEEANKVNNALNETKNTLSSLPRMTELDTQFSSLDAKLSSLNSELTSGKISVADYKKEVKSLTSEYSKLVTIQQNRDVETYKQNAKAAEQEAKAVKDAWDKNVKAIQDYMDAVTKLNNLKAQDKGTGTKSNEIENQVKVIEELKEKALEARANISSMINPHSAPIEEWREYLDVMRLFEQAAFGSSESVAKLEDAIKNMNASNLNALEKAGNTFKSQAFNLSIKPDDQHQFSSWVNKLKELNLKIDEYSSKVKYLKENNITDEEQIKEVEKLRDSIDETIKTMSKTPQANRGWTQLSIDKTIQKMNDDLKENSGYSKETKRNIQALIEELKNIPDRPLSEILNDFYRFKREAHDAGKEGKSFFAILKDKTIYGYAAQLASTYLSFTDMVRYVGQGIDAINEFDTGLTKISYTMDMTKSQLNDLGNSILNMASDMKTSIDDAISVAQIYANMNTSAEEIKKLSEPTLILSNLSGFDSATIADDIQAVTQQFEMAADESMHIADVYDYISRNIAVDYSKFWSLYWKQYNENKSKSVKTKLFYN